MWVHLIYHSLLMCLFKNKSCTSHDIKTSYDKRITAIGCQNGWLGVYFVDSIKNG